MPLVHPSRVRLARTPMRLGRAVLCGALGLTGCTPHGEAPPAEATHNSLVQLELTYGREGGREGGREAATTRLSADAHFVRYRAADREVDERAVAALLGVSLADSLAVDTCAVDPGVESGVESTGAGALEVSLLDAGVLHVGRDEALLAQLVPQHYPELLPFVSGVVYAAEVEGEAAQPSAGARLRIEAEGGEDVGPFSATVAAPTAFPGLRTSILPRDLELDWTAAAPNDGQLTIDLRWAGAQPGAARCRVRDDGRFLVPRGLAAGLDAALGTGAVHVSAARATTVALDAPGAGPGRLIVTLRDAVNTSEVQP